MLVICLTLILLMPATANSFFQYRFDGPGDFAYHCIIHPWRVAAVSVSDSLERGVNFELTSGTGPVWNFSKDFRTLLNFEPRTCRWIGQLRLLTISVSSRTEQIPKIRYFQTSLLRPVNNSH